LPQTISYDSNGLFLEAKDSFGNSLTVSRNTQGSIGGITLNGGGTVQYGYANGGAFLTSVTNLDGTVNGYEYGDPNFPNALTIEIDENGTQFSSWGYDSQERATSSQLAGGANATTLVYNPNGTVTITDALGAVRTFSYTRIGDINRVTAISGSQCATCQEMAATTYDAYGWVSSRTDYNGNLTCYANDPVRGLELVRVEGFAPGSTCPSNLSSYTPASGTLQRKITTVWSPTWREPTLITQYDRTTSFNLDGYGNILTMTVTDTSVNPNVSRTWTHKYFNNGLYGQVQTLTGPRTDITTDVTSYTYFNCATGGQCGQINTITSAPTMNAPGGLVTTFNTYNAYGQPLTLTDPNGVPITLTYDARERLKSSEIGTETTAYSYWPTGLLDLVTLPDGSTILYNYNGAHQLTQITDTLGNYIIYTLDPLGNHLADNEYTSSGALERTHTRQFNTLSQLAEDINAANTAAVTTSYGYDSNGNQTAINAPMSRNTAKFYDGLNRLDQITDPMSGNTYLGYDPNNNLASVKDPRSFTTQYAHNGFNDLTSIISPDTGTSSNTYDSAGNLSTAADARGALATYSYDALNRELQVIFSLNGIADQTINFGYDSGVNGLGRLTSVSDANHSMSWTYDTHGRVTGKGQTVAGVTLSVGYSYTNDDLITLVTPSHQTVTYGYANHQVTSIAVNGTTILNGVTYNPFGPPTGWTWGNGSTVSRSFNEDGGPLQIVTAGVTNVYAVDDAERITSITDSGLSTNNWSFTQYDYLDRVLAASSSPITEGFTYDANGNRTTTTGTTASIETVATKSNRLNKTTGTPARTYNYDAAGNTLSYTGVQFTYDNRGRVISAGVSGAGTTNYVYNALGQLIEKSGYEGTILLVYDEAGHILGEYSSTGALIQETIWMGDRPVATLRPRSGGSIAIFYVSTDHLGTPRKVTRSSSDNGLVWRWDPDTYGTAAANQNPAGYGTFVYNLRFPGQYYLPETGFYQNYLRDYDPQMGRYLESDPIGLHGGINTYAYVNGNPVTNADPSGRLLHGLINAGESYGASAAQYWADQAVSTGNPLYNIPGALAALWTPATSDQTLGTLLAGYGGGGLAGSYANLAEWASNPVLYEVGQMTLPDAVYAGYADLSATERGAAILADYGWSGMPGLWLDGAWGTTITGTGLTPGASLLFLNSGAFLLGLGMNDGCSQ
jgi:RHS repeat-associated protein